MRSIIPSEYVDVEYLLALTHKVKDDVKDEVLIRIEQIRRMHSNFRLRLYRPLPLTFGKQSLHNEPIYEGEEENNLQAAASFASSPLSLANTTMPSRPTTSTYTAPPAVTPSTDLFDLIGLGPTTSTSASNEVVSYGVSKDQAVVPQPQWMASSTSTPTAALPSSTSLTNGMNAATATSQINVNTNWAAAGSTSQPSSRSKADEWLEDAFRTALTVNSPPLPMSPVTDMPAVSSTGIQSWQTTSSHSMFDSPVTSGPPPAQPPPPLPSKEVVVNGSLSARSGSAVDAFGQSVKWDAVPSTPVPRAEDPFDIQWSRLAVGPAIPSNPFISEAPRELRT
ncbi:hypothetical protein Aduo_015710 [Ancylostoma duodenale]